jgi:peptidoglycan/xylan/chitin deacetylase (PgdA/CDA1 family)
MRILKGILMLTLAVCLLIAVSCIIGNENKKAPSREHIADGTTESEPSPGIASPTPAMVSSGQETSPAPDISPSGQEPSEPTPALSSPEQKPSAPAQEANIEPVDYSEIRPNESGDIPIVMFHNFVEDLDSTNDEEFTTSFEAFEELLETLYNEGYRLISMRDFIDHNISVPAGTKPMVFTFDDGSPGQFNLIEENGKLVVNPKSAAGIMIKFSEKHPDFGLKGIFYLNMDKEEKTFEGAGTLKERLEILMSYGFEVGNHSWGHFYFSQAKNREQIYERLGRNQKRLQEIIGGVSFYSLALPHGGKAPEELKDAMIRGEYEGTRYFHETIMAVGSTPSVPSIHKDYNPEYVARIRSQGKVEIKFDLTYWLPNMTRDRMYISDGDPNTVVVPKGKENLIDTGKLNGKKLITY